MTAISDLAAQALVLRTAADGSPMAVYAGMLRSRAIELDRAVKAWRGAVKDGIAEDRLELVPAAALEIGVTIYWPGGFGCCKVIRVAQGGTGLHVEPDFDQPLWVNVLAGGSPVVVVAPVVTPEPEAGD